MTWRLLICSLLAAICTLLAAADTLVVAGRPQPLAVPLIIEGDEVLCPLTPALRLLGVSATHDGASITLTTAQKTVIALKNGSTTAQIGERTLRMPVAPREVDGTPYLPMRALASWLPAEARFDAATRRLELQPLLSITYEGTEAGTNILVRSGARLQYTSGKLSDPPRVFFDFKNAALGFTEQQIPVEEGLLSRLRLSQYSTSPDVVRLVADFAAPAGVTSAISDNGRQLTITIAAPPAEPETPRDLLPTVRPVKLRWAALSMPSAQLSELAVLTDGPPQVVSDFDATARKLTLTFANGLNGLAADLLAGLKDKVVAKVEGLGAPDAVGAKLTITLKGDAGYLIEQEENGVRVLLGTFSLANMVVVLDAGHGAHDSGAAGVAGMPEKSVNLDVVLRAEKLLKAAGARVLLTRGDDTFIPLDDRSGLANAKRADVFVSVHCNSTANRNSANGTQTYYKTPQSATLAAVMQTELVKSLEFKNGGVHTANFSVIRKSQMPSVLLELGFINHDREAALLATPEYRQKAAVAIAAGLRRYAATKSWQQRRADLSPLIAQAELAGR